MASQEKPMYLEDEFDLGKYVETLIRQWRLIVSMALIAAFVAGAVSLIMPKEYESSVLVASTKVKADVSFGSAIRTLTDEELIASGAAAQALIDRKARLQSYVRLVSNPSVAEVVLGELGDQLEEDEREVAELLRMVEGDVAKNSDAIEITVTYKDPVLAAALANAWGREYVRQVNSVYAGGSTIESYEAVQKQAADAWDEYVEAQEKLEAFLAESLIEHITRQINELETVIGVLSSVRPAVFDEQITDQLKKLSRLESDARRVDQLLDDAEDMRDQVKDGGTGAAASNALAITLLKAQTFASTGGLGEVQVQTSLVDVSSDEICADLDALVTTLKARRDSLEEQITALSHNLLEGEGFYLLDASLISEANTPLENNIQEWEQQVRELQSQLELNKSHKQELVRARDLAWEKFSTLSRRATELNVSVWTTGSEVALAAPAGVPDKDTVSGARNVMLAGAVGLMLGIFAAYAIEFWWGYKGLEPEPIAVFSIAVGGLREAWGRTRARSSGRKKREIDNDNEQGS